MNQTSRKVMRFTAWSAIIGGLLAYANVGLSVAVTGPDADMVLHGASMLALPPNTRDLFRWCMAADVFGFYLPFLAIGGYFVHAFREELGALGNMVAMAVVLYVVVGVTGAVMQFAILHPLAHLYAGGDDVTRNAAAAVWTALANGTQNGLWWIEGPLVFFWTSIAANALKKAGWKGSFLLKIVSWAFGVFFLFGFFPNLDALSNASEMVVVLVLPLWMLLFGWQLLRRARTVPAGLQGVGATT
ncbi:hypothetical protein [Paraburkholderia aspalathi]|uniref:DUF4386 domain-containing protein n=1 Tax=Paraburkholderia aspalathi TaxID=1324617 RepID=A0A1I7EP08_9BURK|nr:hypothetical protein [Paraburkholderia aspalathi]SFU25651.1 hypothetical protein SAMN05192563_103955 [Paraburkholderia aspalathi]